MYGYGSGGGCWEVTSTIISVDPVWLPLPIPMDDQRLRSLEFSYQQHVSTTSYHTIPYHPALITITMYDMV
jgi:hypothetical protein